MIHWEFFLLLGAVFNIDRRTWAQRISLLCFVISMFAGLLSLAP